MSDLTQKLIDVDTKARKAAGFKLFTAVTGLAVASVGVWMVHPPSSLIFAGILMIASTIGGKR